jgi:hypothetical protein
MLRLSWNAEYATVRDDEFDFLSIRSMAPRSLRGGCAGLYSATVTNLLWEPVGDDPEPYRERVTVNSEAKPLGRE